MTARDGLAEGGPPPGLAAADAAPAAAARKWVLVVDDDAGVRALWLNVLKGTGYAAVGAGDGVEALQLIEILVPDLVLLDMHMPRLSGWEVLARLGTRPAWRRIPVLIVSGTLNASEHDRAGRDANVVGWIEKPVRLDQLMEKVREATSAGGAPVSQPDRAPLTADAPAGTATRK